MKIICKAIVTTNEFVTVQLNLTRVGSDKVISFNHHHPTSPPIETFRVLYDNLESSFSECNLILTPLVKYGEKNRVSPS